MTSSEVYVPLSGDLTVPNPLVRTSVPSWGNRERPASQSSSRFGRMSHNSFFVRHAPHPRKVRHIKGLLDIPICAVNDLDFYDNSKRGSGLQFPPDGYNQKRIEYFERYYDVPSSVINVNSQMYPINTITGLQYFLGKPLNMRVYREKISKNQGLMETTEAWVDELRAIMRGAGMTDDKAEQQKAHQHVVPLIHPLATARTPAKETARPKTQYSEKTGRLIPPPSRAMSRGASRHGTSGGQVRSDIDMESLEAEAKVMSILCQILQTDDASAVKHWLISASEREKALVMDMLRSALGAKEIAQTKESYPEAAPPREAPVDYSTAKIDRLSLDGSPPQKLDTVTEEAGPTMYSINPRPYKLPPIDSQNAPQTDRPVTTEPFRPSSRKSATLKPKPSQDMPTEAKLTYTKGDQSKKEETE